MCLTIIYDILMMPFLRKSMNESRIIMSEKVTAATTKHANLSPLPITEATTNLAKLYLLPISEYTTTGSRRGSDVLLIPLLLVMVRG